MHLKNFPAARAKWVRNPIRITDTEVHWFVFLWPLWDSCSFSDPWSISTNLSPSESEACHGKSSTDFARVSACHGKSANDFARVSACHGKSSEDLARVSTCHGKSSKDFAASYNMKHFLCAFICIYHSLMRWVIYVKNFEFLNVAKFLTLARLIIRYSIRELYKM